MQDRSRYEEQRRGEGRARGEEGPLAEPFEYLQSAARRARRLKRSVIYWLGVTATLLLKLSRLAAGGRGSNVGVTGLPRTGKEPVKISSPFETARPAGAAVVRVRTG